MAFTFGDVRRSLTKKGFKEEKSRDHIYLRFYYNGKVSHLYTKCSHGADKDDIRHPVANAMKKQLSLTRAQMEELIECTMTQQRYVETLEAAGVLTKPK